MGQESGAVKTCPPLENTTAKVGDCAKPSPLEVCTSTKLHLEKGGVATEVDPTKVSALLEHSPIEAGLGLEVRASAVESTESSTSEVGASSENSLIDQKAGLSVYFREVHTLI